MRVESFLIMAKANISSTGVIVGLILILLFFYVYQRIQIFRLGYNVRNVERRWKAIEKENTFLQLKVTTLVNPEHIASEVRRLGLDLEPPKKRQIVRIR